MSDSSYVYGKVYENNCAHFLTNWMIETRKLNANLPGIYCCSKGKPLRVKEMRKVYTQVLGLTKNFNPLSHFY